MWFIEFSFEFNYSVFVSWFYVKMFTKLCNFSVSNSKIRPPRFPKKKKVFANTHARLWAQKKRKR